MTSQRHIMAIKWNDPQLREKALAFFLDVYRDIQKRQRTQGSKVQTLTIEAGRNDRSGWQIGLDNLPEEYLSKEHFAWLYSAFCGIDALLNRPLPDVTDGRVAAFRLLRRRILSEAQHFIKAILLFLMMDKRFNPDAHPRIDATGVLGIGDTKEEERKFYTEAFTLGVSQKVYDILWQPRPADASLDDASDILRKSGDIYFMTLASIFPICAIGKCHMAFDLFVDKIGTSAMEECVKNYVRRRKTMQREIEKWVLQNGEGGMAANNPMPSDLPNGVPPQWAQELCAAVNRNTEATNENANKIANMDRRQRDLFAFIKRTIMGFVSLFAPGRPTPTAEQAAARLMPPDRYACLANVKEPHRSQIKAVIDYTVAHPIVYEQKNRDQFSLSNAARVVWNRDNAKWARIPGSFQTFEDLSSACYHLKKSSNDPFCYQRD